MNWWLLRLNSWPDCVVISRDIARHDSNSNFLSHEEDAGSLGCKIIVLPLELYVQPFNNYLHKSVNNRPNVHVEILANNKWKAKANFSWSLRYPHSVRHIHGSELLRPNLL